MHSAFADPVTPIRRFSVMWSTLTPGQPHEETEYPLICLAAVPLAGLPTVIAEEVNARSRQLEKALHEPLSGPVRMLVAIALMHAERTVTEFVEILQSTIVACRQSQLETDAESRALAVACLILRQGQDVHAYHDADHAIQIAQRMRRRHWWMSVPADLPTAALLCTVPGGPDVIEARIEDTYQSLSMQGVDRGTALHLASAMLAAAPDGGSHARQRFEGIHQAFRDADLELHAFAIALLALLPHEPQHLLEQYRAIDAFLQLHLTIDDVPTARLTAAGLTYLDLSPFLADGTLRPDGGGQRHQFTRLLQSALCCWAAPKQSLSSIARDPDA